ncbi:MAG: ATP-dependent metallopeptidase FtsH/Yme1/Tma family protein, partial [Rhodanobacter sp.]|nr:ATP-dependent metallopeptidase FtsH/Yme1/Tma family protein [Rhodanobacter sp.]
MNDMVKNLLLWAIIAIVLVTVFQSFNPRSAPPSELAYSDFKQQIGNGSVSSVVLSAENPAKATAKLKDGNTVSTMV